MSAIRLAATALTLAVTVVRHPVVRAGVVAIAANPRLRAAAVETTKTAAYNAGRVARRIIPRNIIQ